MRFLFFNIVFIFSVFAQAFAQNEMPALDLPAAEEEAIPKNSVEEQDIPSAAFDVQAVRVILNEEHRKGIDWEAIVSDFHTAPLKKDDNPVWSDKKYRVSVGTVSLEDQKVLLEALDAVGQVTVFPSVSVRLEDDLAQTIVPGGLSDPDDLHLDLTLRFESEGKRMLTLEPFVGVVLKESGKPVAATLKARTQLEFNVATAVVVGGIFTEEEITTRHKLPLLGDLPLLGLVFRSKGKLMQRTETILFVTPREQSGTSREGA